MQGGYLTSKAFNLKRKGRGMRSRYIFPIILYRLSVLPLPNFPRLVLQYSLAKLLWKDRKPTVHKQACCQRPCHRDLGMPDLESHLLAERLLFLGQSLTKDTVLGRKVKEAFPRLKSNTKVEGLGVKKSFSTSAVNLFATFLNQVTFLVPKGTVSVTSGGLCFGSSRRRRRFACNEFGHQVRAS